MRIRRTTALGLVTAVALATAVVSATALAGTGDAAGASLRIDPATMSVIDGQTFAVRVVQDSTEATSGVQASIDFDPSILQVVSVSRGSAYATAPIFEPQDLATAIGKANLTGHLAQIAAAFTPPAAVPTGTASFLVIRFRAVGCGQTDLKLPTSGDFNAQMISGQTDGYGHPVPVVTSAGHVITCVSPDAVTADASGNDSADGPPVGLIGLGGVIAAATLGALALLARRRDQPPDVAR